MDHSNRDTRSLRLLGFGFALLFTVATIALFGDLVGAFADAGPSFAYFDTSSDRLRHAAGAYLLTFSGLLFIAFAVRLTEPLETPIQRSTEVFLARASATAFASFVGVTAAAFATVSLSVEFGSITGDPGIEQGRDLLPQFGYVVLFIPGALCAGGTIVLLARGAARTGQLPVWVILGGYLVAAAQLFSVLTLPLILVPLWVLAACVCVRRSHDDAGHSRLQAQGHGS